MADITRKTGWLTTRVVGEDSIEGRRFTVSARKAPLLGAHYDVLLEEPGREDEPRLVASGTFLDALNAIHREEGTKACAGLLNEVSLSIGDPEAGLAKRFRETELSVLALLVAGEMTQERMSDVLRLPDSTLHIALAQLRGDGIVWRKRAESDAGRPYLLSATGMKICEMMRTDERFVEAARRILEAGRG